MDHFHDLFIADNHFFLIFIPLTLLIERTGCCGLSSAIFIYLKKASLKLEKEGGKYVFFSDLTLVLIWQSLPWQILQTLLGKKKFTE